MGYFKNLAIGEEPDSFEMGDLPPELTLPTNIIPSRPQDDLTFALQLVRNALKRISREQQMAEFLADTEVMSWKLYSGQEFGGIFCADDRCDRTFCQGHNSEIFSGSWIDIEGNSGGLITAEDLLLMIRVHIDGIRQRSAEQ